MPNLIREVIPLSNHDCFAFLLKNETIFDSCMHMHETMEISLVVNAAGAKRVIGAHEYVVAQIDMAIIGPNVSHGFVRHLCKANAVQEITIQVHKDFFKYTLFQKKHLANIKLLFDNLSGGIVFSPPVTDKIAPYIAALKKNNNFTTILELLSIFHHLSIDKDLRFFTNSTNSDGLGKHCEVFRQAMDFMESNYSQNITPSQIAKKFQISVGLLGRIIKKNTGMSFTDKLIYIRLNHVTAMLIDSTHSVREIAYICGFQHMCTFNKVFKKIKNCTPTQFRGQYLN